jgi:hypothetical protein
MPPHAASQSAHPAPTKTEGTDEETSTAATVFTVLGALGSLFALFGGVLDDAIDTGLEQGRTVIRQLVDSDTPSVPQPKAAVLEAMQGTPAGRPWIILEPDAMLPVEVSAGNPPKALSVLNPAACSWEVHVWAVRQSAGLSDLPPTVLRGPARLVRLPAPPDGTWAWQVLWRPSAISPDLRDPDCQDSTTQDAPDVAAGVAAGAGTIKFAIVSVPPAPDQPEQSALRGTGQ